MEDIKKILISLQEEVRQQKVDMQSMKEEIKNTIINTVNDKITQIEIKNEQLEENLEKQKTSIKNLERFNRRKNLIFFGVEENEKSYHSLEEIILDIIRNYLKIRCDDNCIEYVRRLGKKGEKIRPIVVTLHTMGLKIKIQKNKKKLETTSYYIKEDYPLDVLIKRKELHVKAEREREQGRKAIIKYDKLIIINNDNKQEKHTISQENKNKKRNLSESPETTTKISEHREQSINQPKKINKTYNMNNYLIKAPTFSIQGRNSSLIQNDNQDQDK
ncbi:hypothetical protein EVAR_37801_1 [Eumeta japonica]|uniref:Endonuclease-reverse transcriptase n=1 Tax=Eumeta variegata TaxID=151549 RepID=A0A4C1W9S0_EUMVA|nr:hypothetical protein EVAR_37801_1 [Eumeta japonica]